MNCLRPLEHWDRGFEFHSRNRCSVYGYSVSVLSCVRVAALRRAHLQSKESYRLCQKDQETEKAAKVQQRAVEPLVE
jgi:hypothetical protein